MIKLSRAEIHEIARAYVFANTPKSLYDALLRSRAIERLRGECTYEFLCSQFDSVTARPNRSAIVMAFAYALLAALLTSPNRKVLQTGVDVTRLLWGLHFEAYSERRIGEISIPFAFTSPADTKIVPSLITVASPGTNMSPNPNGVIVLTGS